MGTDSSGLPWCEPTITRCSAFRSIYPRSPILPLSQCFFLRSGPGRRKGKSIPYNHFGGRVVIHKSRATFGNYYSRKVIRKPQESSCCSYAIIAGTDSSSSVGTF